MGLRRWLIVLPLRLRSLFQRRAVERDLDDELAFHLEMSAQQETARGLDEADARRAAQRRFGGLALQKDAVRDTRGFLWLELLTQDVRHAWRALRRTPGYTVAAMSALAIGIGATAALTAAIDAILLKPLPLPQVERLRWLDERRDGQPSSGTVQRLKDWAASGVVESAAGVFSDSPVVRGNGIPAPERIDVMRMFGPFVETMGLTPVAGRLPTPDEARGVGESVVLLSHRFWRQRLEGRATVLGTTFTLDGAPHTVIGVLPAAAEKVFDVELWAPAPPQLQNAERDSGFLAQFVRLAPGVTDEMARAAFDAAAARLALAYPATDRGRRAELLPFGSPGGRDASMPLLVLLSTALLVLLVATLNVAALSLARGIGRLREASLRVALGAGRARLVRLHLIESGLVTIGGVALGLAFASILLDLLKAFIPFPRLADAAIDGRLLLFAGVLAATCTLVVGALPALLALRCAAAPVLREGGPQSAGLVRGRWRAAIVIAEVTVAVVVLVTASLLTQSLVNVARLPLGFEPEHTLSFRIPLSSTDGDRTPDRVGIAEELTDQARAWPGVRAVGVADRLPIGGSAATTAVTITGATLSPELARQEVGWRTASAGYFVAAGIPLTRGRFYAERWTPAHPREALVNETFVRRYLPGLDPIGREVGNLRPMTPGAQTPFRIVGVVGDVRSRATQLDAEPQVYVPWAATTWPTLHVVIRTTSEPEALLPAVRLLARSLGDNLTIEAVQTLHAHLDGLGRERRLRTSLVNGLALTALALAVLGLYGLLAGEVAARRQELGVRLTLGARPQQLLTATCLRGVRLAAIGLVLGLLTTPVVARAISRLLVGVSANDWLAPAFTCAVLLLVATLASLAPALRASRVDPAAALRHE
jgi:putative ABC transport system permease protein